MPIRGDRRGARGVVRLRCVQWPYFLRIVLQICVTAVICDLLIGCSAKDSYSFPAQDVLDTIRNADLGPRSPSVDRQSGTANRASRPLLVPGYDADGGGARRKSGEDHSDT